MELKPISRAGIPAALQKAERYRLLNDSACAESICLDVLAVDPHDQQALVMLLLAITDQFGEELTEGVQRARQVLPRLRDEYKRAYYAGIICERRARAQFTQRAHGASDVAVDWYRQAMKFYEEAERLRPTGNDESILRWNTCARMLAKHEKPAQATEYEPALED